MMKAKRILSLVLALSVILGATTLFGCGKGGEEKGDDTLIAGFETIEECTMGMRFMNYFGKLRITDDEKYVTQGSGAAKINACGDSFLPANGAPALEILLEKEKSDLSDFKRLTADVYNATDHDYKIGIYFRMSDKNGPKTKTWYHTVPQDEWAIIYPACDNGEMNMSYDMKNVFSIGFEFERHGEEYEGSNDVYLDNVRIERLEQPEEFTEFYLDENEFCSFDKLYQGSACFVNYYSPMADYQIYSEINSDLRYSRSGRSLKVVKPGYGGSGWGWPCIEFGTKFMESINMAQYDGDDVLSFWVYNASDISLALSMKIWRESVAYTERGFNFTAAPNVWTNCTITLNKINEEDHGVGELSKDIDFIRFVFSKTEEEQVVYFDEFRIIVNG